MNFLFTKTPLAFFVQNLWRDEAFTFLLSEQSIGKILQTTAADFNPPLYYIFMHYWMLIFGSSEIAMRSVSVFFYVLTIFFMFEIMVLVFKISFKRALVYFMLIIANPVLLTYAFEARMYMMGAFFVTLSYFALWTGRKKLYIFAVVLALHTHYFTILVFLAQMVSEVIRILKSNHRSSKLSNLGLRMGIIAICFIPWILFFLSYHKLGGTQEFWIIKPPEHDIWYLPLVLFTGYQRVFGEYYHDQAEHTSFHIILNILIWGIMLLPWTWIVLSRKIVCSINYHLPLVLWALFPPIALYVISQYFTPVYHPRYFMFSVVGVLLYMIQIIETAFPAQKTTSGKNHLMMIVVVSLFLITSQYNKLNQKYNAKRTISPLFQEINRSMREGDKVYLTSELDYFLAKYYMKNDAIFIFGIPYAEIHEYVGKVLIPPGSCISSGIPTYPARAFFVYYDRYVVRSEM